MELTLFDQPLARKTDPITSHEAAYDMVESGKVGRHEQMILEGLRSHPCLTAAELCDYVPLRHDQIHKRLRGLVRKGWIVEGTPRVCRKHGSLMLTWLPRTINRSGMTFLGVSHV